MQLSLNNLSLNGQFQNIEQFLASLSLVMRLRQRAIFHGYQIYCNRSIASTQITPTMILPQAVQRLSRDMRSQLLLWVQQNGPFWDDDQQHSDEELFEIDGEFVMHSALAEAATHLMQEVDHRVVSFIPSAWGYSPIIVNFHPFQGEVEGIAVDNYFDLEAFEIALEAAPNPIRNWGDLAERCRNRFTNLTISDDTFMPLDRIPFVVSASQRIMVLLGTLDKLKTCFNSSGERTNEGHEIYDNYFTGERARFSDSSDAEKKQFLKEMTFRNPVLPDQEIFCPMHGKIQTPQLRIHFSSPISRDEPLIIPYVGPKLTKR